MKRREFIGSLVSAGAAAAASPAAASEKLRSSRSVMIAEEKRIQLAGFRAALGQSPSFAQALKDVDAEVGPATAPRRVTVKG